MKKILLIIAAVVCVVIAGTALAVNYNSASPVTGTLTADTYFALSLDNCSTSSVTLSEGVPTVYTIQCDVTNVGTSETADLIITLTDGAEQDLDDVTVALFTDANCTQAVAGKTQTGAGTITVSGISATTTYYARITIANGLDSADFAACGGTMALNLNRHTA